MKKNLILCVLDGWGVGKDDSSNAIYSAKTPVWDKMNSEYCCSYLKASGNAVGLPSGQMGNSEVGHTTIGAGRVLPQSLTTINQSIIDGSINDNPVLLAFLLKIKNNNGVLHFVGLLSDGGVHSHIGHLIAIIDVCKFYDVRFCVHAFFDGRDAAIRSALNYITGVENIVTVGGRYYGMDRDNNWERIKPVYEAIVGGVGRVFSSAQDVILDSYDNNISDEFIVPSVVGAYSGIHKNDGVFIFNFRKDRISQLLSAMFDISFEYFERISRPIKNIMGIVSYGCEFNIQFVFETSLTKNTLGEVLGKNKLSQLRVAETEKYAHVTFFFNGRWKDKFNLEERALVPSSKIATYDLEPEMQAGKITDVVIKNKDFDFILVNYANPDLVGHTGNMKATVKAIEEVDFCLGRLLKHVIKNDIILIITADHGNAELMFDKNGIEDKCHTTNLVPFIVVDSKKHILKNGSLADIAPTVLNLLNIDIPDEMRGGNLIVK